MTKATKILYSVLAVLGALFLFQAIQIKHDVEDLQKGHGKFGATVLHSSTSITGGHTNATTTTAGFQSAADKIKEDLLPSSISVVAVATSALPANTYVNGTLGQGATMTANANGAFPTLDNVTVNVNDSFLYNNGTVENGIWDLTNAGSGGSTWIATRNTSFDTASEMYHSRVVVKGGTQSVGGVYIHKALKSIVVGTSTPYWIRQDSAMGPNEGYRCSDEMQDEVFTVNTPSRGGCSFQITSNTGTATVGAGNATSGVIGEYVFTTSTGTTNYIGISESGAGNATGGQFVAATNVDVEIDMRWQEPVVSNGTNQFAVMNGLVNVLTAGTKLPIDGITFVTDTTSVVSATNFLAVTSAAGTSTGTILDTGISVSAGSRVRGHISHDAGDTDWRFYLQGALVGTLSSNIPTVPIGAQMIIYKNAGTGATNGLTADYMSKAVIYPQRRSQ